MLILGQKGANLDQKGPKMGGAKFSPDCKPQFSKRRPRDNFLYQKSTKFNEPFGRYKLKCWFWAKKGQIWTKMGPKWVEPDFSQNFHLVISSIDPKCSLDMQNQEDPMTSFWEIGQKSIFGLKRAFLDLNWPKKGETGFFGQNPKMSLPSH